jgi:tape measure domain-containing protein
VNDNLIKILITAQDNASSVLEGVKKQAAETADASKRFAAGLAVAATATAGFIGYGAKVAGDLEASRAGFITLLGSAKEADDALAMIKRDAASTPFELPGLISANQLLTSVTKNAVQSENLLMNVGKALTAMGKGQPELDRIIVNLQQIGAVGKASLMDVRQFAFAGIPIFEMLQQKTGKTGEALNDFISEGGVTFGLLEQMFNEAGTAGGRFADAFANQAGGFNQILANLQDTFTIAMSDIVTKSGAFDIIKGAMAGLGDWINANKEGIAAGIKGVFEWVINNGPLVAGVLLGALLPAFVSLAAGIWATIAPLLPFMAVGGALAVLANNWAKSIGGWGAVMQKVKPFIDQVKLGVSALFAAFKEGDVTSDGFVGVMERIGVAARQVYDYFMQNIVPVLQSILAGAVQVAIAAWNGLVSAVQFLMPSLTALWNMFANNLLPALIRLWNFVSPVLIPVLQVVGAIIGVALVGAIWVLVNALRIVGTVIATTINVGISVFQFFYGIVAGVINGIVAYFNFVFGVWNYIFNWLRAIVNLVWSAIWSKIGGTMTSIGNAVSGTINNIVGWFNGIWGRISGGIGKLGSMVGSAITGAVEGVKGGVKGAINWVIDRINDMIGKVNSVADKIPGAPKLGTIPRLYTGGRATSGGWAIVGDAGPEAMYVPAGAEIVSNRNTQQALANGGLPGAGGGNSVSIKVEYNGRGQFSQEDAVDMAKQIRDALRAQGLDMNQIGALRG